MNEDQVLEILTRVGAFRAGHFVLTSGLHSDSYILKDAMYAYTQETSDLCKEMATRFLDKSVEAVIGPAVGAAILSQWTAHHLAQLSGTDVFAVYADKDGLGGFVIKRGYDAIIKGKKTLVVEDLTTTGGSIKKVVEAARAAGADVVGAIAICNRGSVTAADVGNPAIFEQLVHVELDTFPADSCELCQKNIPINTDIGHGQAFLAKNPK